MQSSTGTQKILPNLIGTENVDRLPVIITAPNVEQLLGVPHLSSGIGKEISSAVYNTLNEWNMLEKVQAFVFDTTASNSGRLNGSCVLLEQMLNRPILFLTWHHILEIILQSVFSYSKLTTMSSPEISIFKRFKNNWNQIDQTKFSTYVSDTGIKKILHRIADDVIIFCKNALNQNLPRDDYKEFLELLIIFVGGVPPKENFDVEDDELNTEIQKRYLLKISDVSQFFKQDLPVELLTPKSKNIFQRFQLSMAFLHQNPENWPNIKSYTNAKNILQHLNVVNDVAERGVKLMEDFNTKFTKNENQKQYVLKVVQEYRKKYPSHRKDAPK
ncbi:hypothetical protein QTP88_003398 [Uroleucon formosanum]